MANLGWILLGLAVGAVFGAAREVYRRWGC